MNTFLEIAQEIGELVAEKNAAYGSSFAKAGQFLQLLYPDGISTEEYADALLLVRIFDKQMRIATDREALGESPYQDIAGYGILGVHMHHQAKEQASWQGTANAGAATPSAGSTCGSAPQPASATTTTNESATSEPQPSQPPRNFFARWGSANASGVMEVVNESAVGRRGKLTSNAPVYYDDLLWRSNVLRCAWCNQECASPTPACWIMTPLGQINLRCCSSLCSEVIIFLSNEKAIVFAPRPA